MNRNWAFQSEGYCFFIVVLTVMSCFNPLRCYAQIEMKETGFHFQDFNSLYSATESSIIWKDNLTIPGWYWQYLPPTTISPNYFLDDGTSSSGGRRCYGNTGNPDRAIGGLCNKDFTQFCYGIKLHNSSTKNITNISLGYTGEQWRICADITQQYLAFSYKITTDQTLSFTSSPLGSTWVGVNALYFISPKTGPGSNYTLNGNDPSNRVKINEYSIPGIVIPPGSYLLLRWRDLGTTLVGDFGLAIDDVTVKWTVPANVSVSSFAWTGSQSNVWSDYRNWSKLIIPGSGSDVEIASAVNEPVCTDDISIKNLVILNGGHLTINAGKTITVSENCTFNGKDCLVLKSPNTLLLNTAKDHAASASLIYNGIASGSGSMKVERYIKQYSSNTDGWHFFSSPLNQPAIDAQFIPGTNDDFFTYFEIDDTWLNQKTILNDITSFVNGLGYLVSYQNKTDHSISGLPNNADISFNNLSFTGDRGWHLLGNPYPSGISWDTGDWGITGISHVAKLLNSGGTYSDLSFGESIPSMNGFFIKVNSLINNITIPRSARLHTINEGWKRTKALAVKKIKLVISSNSNNTFAETKIILNEKATTGYDLDYDSPYLSGIDGTPLFYSVLSDGKELSTNCVPETPSLNFNFEFTPGLAKEYTLKAEISDEWASKATFILEDKLTKLKYTLNNSSAITFSSDTIDAPDRFKLMIDIVTGIEKKKSADSLHIITRNKHVYVSVPDYINAGMMSVYDLSGRQIFSSKLINGSMDFKLQNTGFYLVHILFKKGSLIRKIYIP